MNVPPDSAPGQGDDDARVDADATPTPTLPMPTLPMPVLPTPALPAQSTEDTDVGWGEYAEPDDSERLARDRPPHWDDV